MSHEADGVRAVKMAGKRLHVSLKAGQRIYINGAVIEADRRVGLQLVNDAAFLLDTHVLAADEATTPLRRLYRSVQGLLTAPLAPHDPEVIWRNPLRDIRNAASGTALEAGLHDVARYMEAGHVYDALRALRKLFHVEDALLGVTPAKKRAGS